ncbi:hypothetical protein [Streptosporangium sp. NPDC004631]
MGIGTFGGFGRLATGDACPYGGAGAAGLPAAGLLREARSSTPARRLRPGPAGLKVV